MRDRVATKEDPARGDIEQAHMRPGGIGRASKSRLGHVESETSRVRGVLHLPAKDRPHMPRPLGQAPPPGG